MNRHAKFRGDREAQLQGMVSAGGCVLAACGWIDFAWAAVWLVQARRVRVLPTNCWQEASRGDSVRGVRVVRVRKRKEAGGQRH